jgi:hypothetical protein
MTLSPDTKGQDGVYTITVGKEQKSVFCDMTTDNGGWTVSLHWYSGGCRNFEKEGPLGKEGYLKI